MHRFTSALPAIALLAAPSLAFAQGAPPAPPAPPSAPTSVAATAPVAPVAPAPPSANLSRDEVLVFGRFVADRAMAGQVDTLVATADPAVGAPDAVRERLETAMKQMSEQLGGEVRIISEKVMRVNGGLQYWRTADYANVPVPLVFRVVLGSSGKWRGFTASPEEAVPAGEEVKP